MMIKIATTLRISKPIIDQKMNKNKISLSSYPICVSTLIYGSGRME